MTFDSIITIAAFCCYLIFMLCIGMYFVGKNPHDERVFSGRPTAWLVGNLYERTGVRHVRLAADGPAGCGIPVRYFRRLDRHWPGHRHLP